MESTKKIKMIVEKTDTGFSAYSSDYLIFTTGKSVSELISNAYEAAELYFEEEAVKLNPDDMMFEIDFQQFFEYYKVLNPKKFAERIGINPILLSEYIQGSKSPSVKQKEKILTGINQIGQELSGVNLFAGNC